MYLKKMHIVSYRKTARLALVEPTIKSCDVFVQRVLPSANFSWKKEAVFQMGARIVSRLRELLNAWKYSREDAAWVGRVFGV